MAEDTVERDQFLAHLGGRIKTIRRARKMSRRHVADISDVSQRFLAQFESGEGNISIARLYSLCEALNVTMESVLGEQNASPHQIQIHRAIKLAGPAQLEMIASILGQSEATIPTRQRIALTGLRGAGKSTLGGLLAAELNYSLIELDREVEKLATLKLAEVFSLYGQEGYRRLEREALEKIVQERSNVVIAAGGSIVTDQVTYNYLLSHCLTVWISTSAEEHISRVIEQGDEQLLASNDSPVRSVRVLLEHRKPLYAQAALTVSNASRSVDASLQELLDSVRRFPV